jgi:protection-of-telomeres protein 1
MGSTMDSSEGELPLPTGFLSIEQIKNLPDSQIKNGAMQNVIGFVKDFRSPFRSKGPGTSSLEDSNPKLMNLIC